MTIFRNPRAILLALACSVLIANQDPPDVEALKKGQPKDIASYISRVFGCNHWAGEEPYDKARAKQIKKALKALRCDQLVKDGTKLRKKYQRNPKVLAALEETKNL